MKRALLVYNPYAGNGVIREHLDTVIDAFENKGMLLVPFRLGGTHTVEQIMTEHPIQDYSQLIVAGGDGTVNLVVNAMIRHDVNVPLAIFPTGTANDLAAHLGIPSEIDKMIEGALSGDYMNVDVGKAGSKYFINVLAIGMLVDVSQRTDPAIKNAIGIGAYYLRSLAEVPFAHPHKLKITSKEQELNEEVTAVLVMNGRSAGGFKEVAPFSEVSDGLFDVVVIRKLFLPNMLPALLSVLTGSHTKSKRFVYFRTAKLSIKSESDEEIFSDIDGEKGDSLPLDIEILPGRLTLCKYTEREHYGRLSNFYG